MKCSECGEEKDITYRNPATGNATICYGCIVDNHPEVRIGKSAGFPEPPENVSGPVHHVGDVDISVSEEKS